MFAITLTWALLAIAPKNRIQSCVRANSSSIFDTQHCLNYHKANSLNLRSSRA